MSKLDHSDPATYSFDASDDSWVLFLNEHGYVVIKQAVPSEDVEIARNLVWDDLEATAHRSFAIPSKPVDSFAVRNDISTWTSLPTRGQTGIMPKLAQSAGAWHIRGVRGVYEAFSKVWDEQKLIVSMDCMLLWRPWWVNPHWKPVTEGLHLDQNPFNKPNKECVQGMVPLYSVNSRVGGLQVVPDSHLDESKEDQRAKHPHLRNGGDWCPLHDPDLDRRAVLLQADPGDLILWDSRTVHGGLVGTGEAPKKGEGDAPELARLSCTVSMVPMKWATPDVLKIRRRGYEAGMSFNHSPHEAGTSSGTMRCSVKKGYVPPPLNACQRELLDGTGGEDPHQLKGIRLLPTDVPSTEEATAEDVEDKMGKKGKKKGKKIVTGRKKLKQKIKRKAKSKHAAKASA